MRYIEILILAIAIVVCIVVSLSSFVMLFEEKKRNIKELALFLNCSAFLAGGYIGAVSLWNIL